MVKKIMTQVLMKIVMLFVIIISAFPLLWVLVSSFKTNSEILSGAFTLPGTPGFEAYEYLFSKYNFLQYAMNSIIVTFVSVAISLVVFTLAGYVFARYQFPGKALLFALFTITMLIPGYAKTQPIFSLIMNMGLYDTKTGLILVYISNGMAVSVFLLKNAFQVVPKELSEAAKLEGAGFLKTFCSVNLPLAKDGLVTAAILMFLGNWNEYYFGSLLLTSESNNTLPIVIQAFTGKFSYNYTYMFAALVLVILPGIIIYACAQEQVQESLASSGIKG